MPNIKPISDLRKYSEVLNDVAVGSPVFLAENAMETTFIVTPVLPFRFRSHIGNASIQNLSHPFCPLDTER